MYMYVYNFKIHYLLIKIPVREFFVFDIVFVHNYQVSFEDLFQKKFQEDHARGKYPTFHRKSVLFWERIPL